MTVFTIFACLLAWALDHHRQREIINQLREDAISISSDAAWATYWSTRSEVINEVGRDYRPELDDEITELLCTSIIELFRHRKWIDEIDADVMHPNPALETAHQTLEILACSSVERYFFVADKHLNHFSFPELDTDDPAKHPEFRMFIQDALQTTHGLSFADRLEMELFGTQ